MRVSPHLCTHLLSTFFTLAILVYVKWYHSVVLIFIVVAVQSLRNVQLCFPMNCNMPFFPVLHHLLEFAQKHVSIESVMPSISSSATLLLLPSVFPSIRVFSSESALCIRWPKFCSFSFSISPSSEYSGLISFRIDWFDLLEVQGTLKSLPQHHSRKHQFFGAQPSLCPNSHIHSQLLGKP